MKYFGKILFLFPSLLCFYNILSAQDSSHINKSFFLQLSFLYDMPQSFGAAAGMEVPVSSKIKTIIKHNGKKKIKFADYIFAPGIGFYHYPFNSSGLMLMPSFGIRHITENTFYTAWLLSIGVLRTFYDGKVYTVNNTGSVEEKPLFGRFYATTGFSFAAGWDLEKAKKPSPVAIQLKPALWIQYPYNSFIKPHLSFEAGIKYRLKINTVPIHKTIKK